MEYTPDSLVRLNMEPMSQQQVVWLESYKAVMRRTYCTNSDACCAAKYAVMEFNELFGENK